MAQYHKILDSLPRNLSIIKDLEGGVARNECSLPLTRAAFMALGFEMKDLDRLRAIHIAGSKGKGSTCHYVESILRSQGFKTGLFTSPHLITPKERILINGQQLDDCRFEKYVLDANEKLKGLHPIPFFRFMTVLAFKVFLEEQVDVAIVEVGIGGRFDCTNILEHPAVTAVTTLSLEHVNLLGDNLNDIAMHKYGIMKKDCPAFVIDQAPNMFLHQLARKIAHHVGTGVEIVTADDDIALSTSGSFQRNNAALALAVCEKWYVYMTGHQPDRGSFHHALSITKVPCRQERLDAHGKRFYLDVSHTIESIVDTCRWFRSNPEPSHKVLLFYCGKPRDPITLVEPLLDIPFSEAYFIDFSGGEYRCLSLEKLSGSRFPFKYVESSELEVLLNNLRPNSSILVCGSFYLTGAIYGLLRDRNAT